MTKRFTYDGRLIARPALRILDGEMATADLERIAEDMAAEISDAAARDRGRDRRSVIDHEAALRRRMGEMVAASPSASDAELALRYGLCRAASATATDPTPGDADPAAPPPQLALRIAAGLSALALVAVTSATFFAVRP